MESKLKAACVHSVSVDCCCGVCMVGCVCARPGNNVTQLTKPFLHTNPTQTHMQSPDQMDMCSAQPVIMAGLMWSLGGTEAIYY